MLNKTTIGVGFLAALLVLIFFSKTIYTGNLPEVSATKPFRGTLDKREISSGIAKWTTLDTFYAPVSGTVAETLVKEGETVRADQPILRMEYKSDDAERKLMGIETSIQKLQGEISTTQSKLANIERALRGTDTAPPSPLDFDIYKAKTALQIAELSFQYGAISRSDLETARNNLAALYLNYEESRDTLTRDLQTKQLDLQSLVLEAKACRETIGDYEKYTLIHAEYSGVIEALYGEKGKFAAENAPLFSIGVGAEFTVECLVSLENNFITQGDTCALSNASHEFKGIVARIKPSEGGKTINIHVTSTDISAGETFQVSFEKKSATSYTLVPSSAVNQDNNGYYLNRIKRSTGILGQEYLIERLDVYIGDSDLQNTAVIQGITFFEPLVLVSNKALQVGDRVLLTNAEDFFEN
jgi:hypothetical protein